MEPGALIRKHSIDAAVLCLLLCITFFAANQSYSDEAGGYGENWYAVSYFQPGNFVGYTQITPNGYAYYNMSRTDKVLTYPNSYQEYDPSCGFPYSWSDMYFSFSPGIWTGDSNHYVDGSGSCNGTWVAHTSAVLDARQVTIDYFYASPSSMPAGGSATRYWGTSNGTSFTIDGTPVAATGSKLVDPTSTTWYTLTASNQYGSVQAQTFVRTNEPLNPNYYRYSVRHEKGVSAFYPYTPVEKESVNSANGNLHFTVPLLSRPGRNGMGINLVANGQVGGFGVTDLQLAEAVGVKTNDKNAASIAFQNAISQKCK
jgi:hypothetical protein